LYKIRKIMTVTVTETQILPTIVTGSVGYATVPGTPAYFEHYALSEAVYNSVSSKALLTMVNSSLANSAGPLATLTSAVAGIMKGSNSGTTTGFLLNKSHLDSIGAWATGASLITSGAANTNWSLVVSAIADSGSKQYAYGLVYDVTTTTSPGTSYFHITLQVTSDIYLVFLTQINRSAATTPSLEPQSSICGSSSNQSEFYVDAHFDDGCPYA
jgi:hypothetical protein